MACGLVVWLGHSSVASAAFGHDGKELLHLGFGGSAPRQAIAYPGGRILISLELFGGEEGPAIVRVRRDGSIDDNFGYEGRAAIGSTLTDVADIAVQRDGGILAAGARASGGTPRTTQAVLVRLLPNGRLDRSFGENGAVVLPFEGRFQQAASVAAMPNGAILVDGGDGYVGRESVFAPSFIVRLRPHGRLDAGFGNGKRWPWAIAPDVSVTRRRSSGCGDRMKSSALRTAT